MKRSEVIFLVLFFLFENVVLGLVSFRQGVKVGTEETCGQLVHKLENQLVDHKISLKEKDIETLRETGCKRIVIRAVNFNNEVKQTTLVAIDVMGGTKVARIKIDGFEKNYEFRNFMQKVIKIECGDSYGW